MASCPTGYSLLEVIGLPAVTFIGGLLVPRFWMSRKESKDVEQANYQNSATLVEKHDEAYRRYFKALKEYRANHESATKENYLVACAAGDDYFRQSRLAASAALSNKLDPSYRDYTLVPHLERLTRTVLSSHYQFAREEAERHKLDYRGTLRRADHESIYAAVERFSSNISNADEGDEVDGN